MSPVRRNRIDLLDNGFVRLVDTMPRFEIVGEDYSSLDKAIVDAARTSYGGEGGIDAARDKKLINYLIEHRHTSPLEQVEFKFQIKAPVVVWWQHVRHRMQEMNLQSGRYMEYPDEFYIPTEWRIQDDKNKQGSSGLSFKDDDLQEHIEEHFRASRELYEHLRGRHVAKEQARLVLPAFSLYHTGISKMNLHALANYISLRNDSHAQQEIREYAAAMQELVTPMIPYTSTRLFRGNEQGTKQNQ